MSTIRDPRAEPAPGSEADPFRYGWKEVPRKLLDGTIDYVNEPLTLEDLLHPEENYKIMNGSRHGVECRYLADVLERTLAHDEHALVLSDTGVYWDDPALKHHSPDIAVILGIREPREQFQRVKQIAALEDGPVKLADADCW